MRDMNTGESRGRERGRGRTRGGGEGDGEGESVICTMQSAIKTTKEQNWNVFKVL